MFAWERQPSEFTDISSLDEKLIRGVVRLGVERGRLSDLALTEPIGDVLGKWKLTTGDRPLNAATALFTKDTGMYTQFTMRLARFQGNDKNEFIDNQRVEGNIFVLLNEAMNFFRKHLNMHGKIVGLVRDEYLEVPAEALREAVLNALYHRQYERYNLTIGIAIYDDRIEIENSGHLPEELTTETIKQSHHSFPQNPTIADVLFKTTFLENWGSGVGRIMDACREANLPEPEYNQNASFVWVTFRRTAIQAYSPSTPTTPQDKNPSTPTTPSTSKREDAKLKRLRTLLSAIGENGASLKVLMEAMQRKDMKGFVSTYITPNIETGYIAMLYPETPNHPMQSYYLTNKGREALDNL
jgi:ATP-dependent DNA helicase RecG